MRFRELEDANGVPWTLLASKEFASKPGPQRPPFERPTQQMQEIHDQIMREGIAKHGGYEIITEGDSFSIAFTSGARYLLQRLYVSCPAPSTP